MNSTVDVEPQKFTAEQVRKGRIATSLAFTLFGMSVGLWLVHIPVVVSRLELEPAMLGIVLLCIGLTGLAMQPFAAVLIARIGSRGAGRYLLPAMVVAVLVPILAPSLWFLFAGAILVGLVATPANIANNTQAAECEAARGRPTMSSFHAYFSVGGLISASLGGVLIGLGWGDGLGAVLVAAFMLAAAVWATANFLPSAPRLPAERTGPRFVLPVGALVGIAVLALICNTAEGAVGDWGALYLDTVKNSGPALAASGYAMFSLAMAAARFAGGVATERLGERRMVSGGGVLIAIGVAIALIAPWPLVSATGFLVVAIGAANISPILMSTAARTPGVAPSVGVATVTTALTVGFLAGPPVIGFIAQALGLGAGLAFVGVLGAMIVVLAYVFAWTSPSVAQRSAPAG